VFAVVMWLRYGCKQLNVVNIFTENPSSKRRERRNDAPDSRRGTTRPHHTSRALSAGAVGSRHPPYALEVEMLVQVRPPSRVLSRVVEVDAVELIAQPTLSVTKSSWIMLLKLVLGESFHQ
jgi:hypothetical protein